MDHLGEEGIGRRDLEKPDSGFLLGNMGPTPSYHDAIYAFAVNNQTHTAELSCRS
jgi:hypothetical protein